MPGKSLLGICVYELLAKFMQSKSLSKRILLTIALMGFVLSPALVFASTNVFTRTLYMGMRGEDVRELQRFLNTDIETRVAGAGAGSTGNETDYFGPATKSALIKFQEKYRADVLTPLGLTSGTGILGAKTREKVSALLDSESIIEDVATLLKQEQASSGLPVRLKIPVINIDTAVEYAGLASDGSMDIRKSPDAVAWFELGPRPGENGSAVIAGHYGKWKSGNGSAFDDLYKLRQGDKLYIEDDKGATISFVVRELRRYDLNADASDVFFSNDGKPHLNLVTCEGVWDSVQKTYSNRLVVFADKE